MKTNVVIMAGGLGKRMESYLPKVVHLLHGVPMICHILKQLSYIDVGKIFIVVGKYRQQIQETIEQFVSTDLLDIVYIDQPEALGTGHALQCCIPELLNVCGNILILSGDVPLIQSKTIQNIVEQTDKCSIVVSHMDEPYGYGRIFRNLDGEFVKIIEQSDCSEDEKNITLVNCGIYCIDSGLLCKHLPNLPLKKEYYLTDVIELIHVYEQMSINMIEIPKERQFEITGVNTIQQLQELSSK